MPYIVIAAVILVCSLQAIRADRLLISALWLAGASASVSILMYLLGAPEVAVIELSVGAGLVTVLFVFAINIAGEDPLPTRPAVPKLLTWSLIVCALVLLGRLTVTGLVFRPPVSQGASFATVLWEHRTLDVLLQVVLIFGGVLSVLGLLYDRNPGAAKENQS